ncbi:MAG: hypothetical protein HY329_14535 [Chloroflexi bacterium]|nr:hypothetical protein [Chloroflexota bacterium]
MPVRKPSNRGGNTIGWFASYNMQKSIAYESLLECDYLYLLDRYGHVAALSQLNRCRRDPDLTARLPYLNLSQAARLIRHQPGDAHPPTPGWSPHALRGGRRRARTAAPSGESR